MNEVLNSNVSPVSNSPVQETQQQTEEQRKRLLRGFSIITVAMVPVLIMLTFSIGFKVGVFIMAIVIIAAIIAINVAFFYQAKRQNIWLCSKDAIRIYSIPLIVAGVLFLLGSGLSLFYIALGYGTPTPGIEGLATLPFWIGTAILIFAIIMTAIAIGTFAVIRKTTRR